MLNVHWSLVCSVSIIVNTESSPVKVLPGWEKRQANSPQSDWPGLQQHSSLALFLLAKMHNKDHIYCVFKPHYHFYCTDYF